MVSLWNIVNVGGLLRIEAQLPQHWKQANKIGQAASKSSLVAI
jgi:hypothetical protein